MKGNLDRFKDRAWRYLLLSASAVFLWSCNKPDVNETRGYVSREDFYSAVGWSYSLPDDATNIRARFEGRGTQANVLYLRFSTNVADLAKTLGEWSKTPRFTRDGKRMTTHLPLAKGDFRNVSGELDWWRPDTITDGYYANIPEPGGLGLRIWVDTGNSVVYVCDQG
jgi:hypothetical protein